VASAAILIPNSPSEIREAYRANRIPTLAPRLILLARLILALIVQALLAVLLLLLGHANPWQEAAGWWMVYGTLIDLGCFALLIWLTRKEGIRPRDLLNAQRERILRDVLLGIVYFIALIPAVVVSSVITNIVYGAQLPPQVAVVHLPVWAAIYSVVVWPIFWALAEELTYLGYAFPRLEFQAGKTWLVAFIVAFFWAFQHIAMPLIFDWTYLVYRVVTAFLVVATTAVLYLLGKRRILPLVIAHWGADGLSAFLASMVPLLPRA